MSNVYRYEDRVYSTCSIDAGGWESYGTTPVRLELLEYEILKETPCGYWISSGFSKRWIEKRRGHFAFTTKAQALESFKMRKYRQIGIHEARIARAREALRLATSEPPPESPEP